MQSLEKPLTNWRLIDNEIQNHAKSINIREDDVTYSVSATLNNDEIRNFSVAKQHYKSSQEPIEICDWKNLDRVTFQVSENSVVKILDCKPTLQIEDLKQEPVICNSQIACLHCGRVNSKENSAKVSPIKSIGYSK